MGGWVCMRWGVGWLGEKDKGAVGIDCCPPHAPNPPPEEANLTQVAAVLAGRGVAGE